MNTAAGTVQKIGETVVSPLSALVEIERMLSFLVEAVGRFVVNILW
jgi:hypothetical protein